MKRTSPSHGHACAVVTGFYDKDTGSIQYVAADPETGKAALIDVVLDFDPGSARTDTRSADGILAFVKEQGLEVEWILDTHPHADHFTAGAYLKDRLGAPQAIGEKLREIAGLWSGLYNEPDAFRAEDHFDRLFADGETFSIGNLPVTVMLSPGHTLGSITFLVGDDAAFIHDTLMFPDSGTSRADFPGGSASALYRSLRKILALPDDTRLFVGHDYCKDGREPAWEATVAEHKAGNIHMKNDTPEAEFVAMREKRDATLSLPDRMLYALQVNLRGGRLPEPEDDGNSYLKIPANRF